MKRSVLVQLALALALLALVLWKADVSDIGRNFADVDPGLAVIVVALNLPVLLLFGVRSHLVLSRLGKRVDADLVLAAAILGNVAGSFTPASSGDLLRAAVLRSHAEIATEDGLALILFERALSVYLMSLATATVAAALTQPPVVAVVAAIAAMPMLAAPLLVPALVRAAPTPSPQPGLSIVSRAFARLHTVASQLAVLFASVRLLALWSITTLLMFAVTTVQFWLLARSVAAVISPEEAWLVIGASQLAGIVSLLPLGFGASDGAAVALLRRLGMTVEQGTVVAVISRAAITLPLGIAAVLSYLYLARRAPRIGADPAGTSEFARSTETP